MVFMSSEANSSEMELSKQESYFLLDNLLSLTDTTGNRKVQLEHYKEWGKLYHKMKDQQQMTKNQLKILLFMNFIADERTKIEPQEEIAKDIMPIFTKQPDKILKILSELPFLISSTCSAVNNYFDLMGKDNGKKQFLKKYEEEIVKSLGKDNASICLSKIK